MGGAARKEAWCEGRGEGGGERCFFSGDEDQGFELKGNWREGQGGGASRSHAFFAFVHWRTSGALDETKERKRKRESRERCHFSFFFLFFRCKYQSRCYNRFSLPSTSAASPAMSSTSCHSVLFLQLAGTAAQNSTSL